MIVFLASFFLSNQINTKEQQFKVTVRDIIDGFSKQDSLKVSKFIDKKTGFYQLYRVGAFDNFKHYKTLGFSDSIAERGFLTNTSGIKKLLLRYSSLPSYDCEKEAWRKKGLYVDTTKTDHLLSQICNTRNKYRLDSISVNTIQSFYKLENKSRRIVLFDDNEKELVFYLSYLGNRWYLTIIDSVTSDCSV